MCEDLQLMSRRTWHCHKQIWSDGFVITLLDQACPCQKLGVISNNQEKLSLMLTWNVNFWMTRCENACMKQKSRKTIRPGLSQLTAQSRPSLSKFAKKGDVSLRMGALQFRANNILISCHLADVYCSCNAEVTIKVYTRSILHQIVCTNPCWH